MAQFRLTHKTSLEQIEEWAKNLGKQCVYAVHSPWWSLWEVDWLPYRLPGSSIPSDPRGSPLFQGNLRKFLESAKGKPEHYGRHGLQALVAAFHGNVEVLTADGRGWRPTSLDNWEAYNKLIDEEQERQNASQGPASIT